MKVHIDTKISFADISPKFCVLEQLHYGPMEICVRIFMSENVSLVYPPRIASIILLLVTAERKR